LKFKAQHLRTSEERWGNENRKPGGARIRITCYIGVEKKDGQAVKKGYVVRHGN